MARKSEEDAELRTLLESGEKAELARALIAPALGVLVRRNAEEDEASARLAAVIKSLVSTRRRLRAGKSVRAWLLGVITDRVPAQRPHSSFPEQLPPGETPEELSEAKGIIETAEGLLSSLDPEQRESLELLAVEGLSPAEAGAILKAPAAVVEQRAEQGLAGLASRMAALMA